MKCTRCGKSIKNIYTWDGEVYGKACWKIIALPVIKEQQAKKETEWNIRRRLSVETAKIKDMTRIKSSFKRDIRTSIIQHYDEKGFITYRQYEVLLDIFNNKDRKIMYTMWHEAGLMDVPTYLNSMCHVTSGKEYEFARDRLDEYYYKKANGVSV